MIEERTLTREPQAGSPSTRFATWVITLAIIATFVVVAASAAFVAATDLVLILFLAMLFSVFLTRASGWLADHSPVSYKWCLAAVTTLLVLLMAGGAALLGVKVNQQITVASKHIDEGLQRLQDLASRYPSVKPILQSTPFVRKLFDDAAPPAGDANSDSGGETDTSPANEAAPDFSSGELSSPTDKIAAEKNVIQSAAQRVLTTVGSVFRTTFGLVVNSLLIFFTGLFIAISPATYRDGVVRLFPLRRRERTREIMNMMGDTLWHWLIGRFGTMLVTGVGAGVLLGVLGVPMAMTLGVVTALLTFIPNIGGLIALMLSVLFALPQGGFVVLLVVVGYIILQLIESYVITPLIQQQQASLPPALLIGFQAVMGMLFGFLGAAVASPLLAAAKVFVEQAYIRDVLEAEPEVD